MALQTRTSGASVAATITLERLLSGMNKSVLPHVSDHFSTHLADLGMSLDR